jgi:arabinose-5-phosphate isomerase
MRHTKINESDQVDQNTTADQTLIQKGRDVLLHSANGLNALTDSLDELFVKAVQTIALTKGRLIVSGVGKSGHVGRKMAATFASTGQPAFFVHAAEAGHGDLGMITKDDTLLLISYSGEASELHALFHYAHRLQLPIISITSKKTSLLATH